MYELIEKKSKFYGYAVCVKSVQDVENVISNLKKEHKKCTHICYAYNIKEPLAVKMCDDGEPGGTAGKPIYNVIDKKGLCDILVVVVRYFGGVKLGAGGLVRAYSKCASGAVEELLCK